MLLEESPSSEVVDPRDAAESVGLVYVSDEEPGIRRKKAGKGFTYLRPGGGKVEEATLKRIRKLAIPPAYTDVWICPKPNGHIQATGRDARGRKQYKYHPAFREIRESTKYEKMMEFAQGLPAIRAKVAEHMALPGLPREKVLATVVNLLETTLIRVGNDDYAKQNKSYGLTTLKDGHVEVVNGSELRFQFKGKSGKSWSLKVKDRRVARIVRACQDLPGQELFQYLDEEGERRDVTSSDVNAYLREITGQDITAKDFRTWHGTVMAALALQAFQSFDTQAACKKNIKAAIEEVASRLGNTPTICRKCYIHPELISAYVEGQLPLEIKEEVEAELRGDLSSLKPEETAVLTLLQARLSRTLEDKLRDSVDLIEGEKEKAKTKRAKKSAGARRPRDSRTSTRAEARA
jgi:DNA topoisomerase-1